jgi:uncharacterized protein YutE (UPF0331/DUF86 family)
MAATSRAVSEDQILEIFERMENGKTLKASCTESKLNYTNVVKRISDSEELTKHYVRARDGFARYMVQHMFEVAADETIDVQRAKLIVDTAKWFASRTLPREYGERTAVDVTTTNKLDSMTREELEAQLKQLLTSSGLVIVKQSDVIDGNVKVLESGND